MSLSKISTEYTEYKLIEFNEGSISLTEKQRTHSGKNIFLLTYDLEIPDSGVLESTPQYIEDGTAGPWEGCGYGAKATLNMTPNEYKALPSYFIDDLEYKMIPLCSLSMSSSYYNHCSCYGPSDACDLSSQCDVSLREIEQWLTGADLVKSNLSGTFVPEEECDIIAENTACAEAFKELLMPYILIDTEESELSN